MYVFCSVPTSRYTQTAVFSDEPVTMVTGSPTDQRRVQIDGGVRVVTYQGCQEGVGVGLLTVAPPGSPPLPPSRLGRLQSGGVAPEIWSLPRVRPHLNQCTILSVLESGV